MNDHDTNGEPTPADDATSPTPTAPVDGDETTTSVADALADNGTTSTSSPDSRPRRRALLTTVAAGVIGLGIGAGAAFGALALFGDDHGGPNRRDHVEMHGAGHGDRHGHGHGDMHGDMGEGRALDA